jgi:hypothetical protein
VSSSLRTLAGALLALLVAVAPAPARASGVACPLEALDTPRAEAEARQMFEGAIARQKSDPRVALEMLLCAQQLADKPAVALRIGTIAEQSGDLELAIRSYERYLILAGHAAPDREPMLERIAELNGRLEAALEPAPEPKDAADSAGATPALDRDSGSGQKIAGWSLTGAGVALLTGGTILLLSAKGRSDALHDIEPNTTYWSSVSGELEAARTEQTLGFVGLGLGAVSSAVGVYLLSTTSGDEAALSARVAAGPGGAGGSLRLRF